MEAATSADGCFQFVRGKGWVGRVRNWRVLERCGASAPSGNRQVSPLGSRVPSRRLSNSRRASNALASSLARRNPFCELQRSSAPGQDIRGGGGGEGQQRFICPWTCGWVGWVVGLGSGGSECQDMVASATRGNRQGLRMSPPAGATLRARSRLGTDVTRSTCARSIRSSIAQTHLSACSHARSL